MRSNARNDRFSKRRSQRLPCNGQDSGVGRHQVTESRSRVLTFPLRGSCNRYSRCRSPPEPHSISAFPPVCRLTPHVLLGAPGVLGFRHPFAVLWAEASAGIFAIDSQIVGVAICHGPVVERREGLPFGADVAYPDASAIASPGHFRLNATQHEMGYNVCSPASPIAKLDVGLFCIRHAMF